MGDAPCDTRIITGPACEGYHYKFPDCLAEALYEESLDPGCADGETGNGDLDGHYALFIVAGDTTATIDPDGANRTVAVPHGNYIVHTSGTGQVSLWTYDTEAEARSEFDVAERRYGLWDMGCNPNDPAGHAECAESGEECKIDWV